MATMCWMADVWVHFYTLSTGTHAHAPHRRAPTVCEWGCGNSQHMRPVWMSMCKRKCTAKRHTGKQQWRLRKARVSVHVCVYLIFHLFIYFIITTSCCYYFSFFFFSPPIRLFARTNVSNNIFFSLVIYCFFCCCVGPKHAHTQTRLVSTYTLLRFTRTRLQLVWEKKKKTHGIN